MILSYTSDDVVLLCFLCSLSFKSSYAKFLLKQIFFLPKRQMLRGASLMNILSCGYFWQVEGSPWILRVAGGRGAGGGKHFHGSSSPRAQGRGRGRLKTFSSLNVLAGGHDLSALQGEYLPDIFRTSTTMIAPMNPMASKTPTVIPTRVTVPKPSFVTVFDFSSSPLSWD